MSANNWTVCPKCESAHRASCDKLESELHESYGKVSLNEYSDLKDALTERQNEELTKEMREDFEIGIEDGVFEYSYSAYCYACNFKFKKTDSQKVELEGGAV